MKYLKLVILILALVVFYSPKLVKADCAWSNKCSSITGCGTVAKDKEYYCNNSFNNGIYQALDSAGKFGVECCCCTDTKGCCMYNDSRNNFAKISTSEACYGVEVGTKYHVTNFYPGKIVNRDGNGCENPPQGSGGTGDGNVSSNSASSGGSGATPSGTNTSVGGTTIVSPGGNGTSTGSTTIVSSPPATTNTTAPAAGGNVSVGIPTLIDPLEAQGDPNLVAGRVIKAFFLILGTIALIMVIYGGFNWMTAAGNASKLKTGKGAIIWVAIGLITMFIAYVIVKLILELVGK